jgi:hypothetical protein
LALPAPAAGSGDYEQCFAAVPTAIFSVALPRPGIGKKEIRALRGDKSKKQKLIEY